MRTLGSGLWAISSVAGLMVLIGCKLVDQTSFGGAPHAPMPAELTAALTSQGGKPLVVIRPDEASPYGDDLLRAISAAEAKGSASFRLVSLVPARGDLALQSAALAVNSDAARQVLDDMATDGVAPDRVTLTSQIDPRIEKAEIRLYQSIAP